MNSLRYGNIFLFVISLILYVTETQAITPPHNENLISETELNEKDSTVLLFYRQQFEIDTDHLVTTPQLRELAREINSLLKSDSVSSIKIRGYASIDGPDNFNVSLAHRRARVVGHWLIENTDVDPSIIKLSSNGNDWSWFARIVEKDHEIPMWQEVLKVALSDSSSREKQNILRRLDSGKVWAYMAANTFPIMRVAEIFVNGYPKYRVNLSEAPTVEKVEETQVIEVVEVEMEEEVVVAPADDLWTRKLYVKSNAPAWVMLWMNAAVEIDLAPHWSFSVPVYWSPYNYGKQTLKFRTLATVPEFRYWFRPDNMGFYVNAHFGVGSYNFSKNK